MIQVKGMTKVEVRGASEEWNLVGIIDDPLWELEQQAKRAVEEGKKYAQYLRIFFPLTFKQRYS